MWAEWLSQKEKYLILKNNTNNWLSGTWDMSTDIKWLKTFSVLFRKETMTFKNINLTNNYLIIIPWIETRTKYTIWTNSS